MEHNRPAFLNAPSGINAGHQPLSGRFLITRGAVDLSSEIKIPADLCFEGRMELRGEGKVVFYGIGRPKDLSMLTTNDCFDHFKLNFEWE